jgi:hypothetical protein
MGRSRGIQIRSMNAASGGRRRLTRIAVAVLVAVLLGVSVACCQQVLSIDGPVVVADATADVVADANADTDADSDADSGPVATCGIEIPVGVCQSCVAAHCCGEATTCAGDPPCVALETCLLGCGSDYACRATCTEANLVAAQTDGPTLDTCVALHCSGECGIVCGMSGSYVEPDAAQGCQECIKGKACPPAQGCATNLDCEITGHCAYACPTPDCSAACLAASTDASAFTSSAVAVGLSCYTPCAVGHYWRCVGNTSWPFAKGTTQTATLTLADPDPNHIGARYAGSIVKACGFGDQSCATVLGNATSDANGIATVPLPPLPPNPLWGFQGYFDIESPSGAAVPLLYFLAFPLSETNAPLTALIPTTTDFQQSMGLVNVTPVQGRGHIEVIAEDCLFIPAADVTVTVDGIAGPGVYVSGAQPSLTATQTDASGAVWFFNVLPGTYTLHVTPKDLDGRSSSTGHVLVRQDTVSFIAAIPTPP